MQLGDLHLILDAIDEPVLLINTDRRIAHANAPAQTMFGESLRGGLVGQSFVRLVRNPDALKCVEQAFEEKARARADVQLLVPQTATYRLTAIYLDRENPVVAVTLKDVTPLLQAAQMRSDFVANVSHELRSPLTTMTGIIETLQGAARDDPQAQTRFLEIMQREAARMDRLIGDLLSLSRVESEERIRPTHQLDLIPVIAAVVATVRERPEGEDREFVFAPEFEECIVCGDADQLTQVFQNLLENACKYSKAGGKVTIHVEARKSAPRFTSAVWAVSVADEGEGIAEEHIPRLQERFYRIDSGRSRRVGGTGLGLAIVKHILNRHRGRLHIASAPGKGVCMTVLLPVPG